MKGFPFRWIFYFQFLLLFLLLTCRLPLRGQVKPGAAVPQDDAWHFSASPYLWCTGVGGTTTVAGHTAEINQTFADIMSNLKFGWMGMSEIRRGRLGLLTDVMYTRVDEPSAIPLANLPAEIPLDVISTTFALTPELAYRVYEKKAFSADALAGLRYYHVGARIDVNPGHQFGSSYQGSDNWVDALGGGRVRVRLTPKAGAFLLGDVGGGGSKPAWQLAFGGGYRVTRMVSADLAYRRLFFHRESGPHFAVDATQQGLLIGATVHFK